MMKRLYLVFAACMATSALFAQVGQIDQLPLTADLGGGVLNADGSYRTSFPATLTMEGQWSDVKLWNTPFSVEDYPAYRVKLRYGFETGGVVQLFARNAAQANNFGGPYMPYAASDNIRADRFEDIDPEGYFKDDPVCVWFALQYTQKESVRVTIEEAALIDVDGNEVISRNIRNDSWKPSPDWVVPEPVYSGDVKFTSRGTVGFYTAPLEWEEGHVYKFHTSEPMPAGFMFVYVLNDGDYTTIVEDIDAGTKDYVAPPITEEYLYAYLSYEGECPKTVHFTGIEREIVDMYDYDAAVKGTLAQLGIVQREYIGADGRPHNGLNRGVNIIRDRMADGTIRVKKVMK